MEQWDNPTPLQNGPPPAHPHWVKRPDSDVDSQNDLGRNRWFDGRRCDHFLIESASSFRASSLFSATNTHPLGLMIRISSFAARSTCCSSFMYGVTPNMMVPSLESFGTRDRSAASLTQYSPRAIDSWQRRRKTMPYRILRQPRSHRNAAGNREMRLFPCHFKKLLCWYLASPQYGTFPSCSLLGHPIVEDQTLVSVIMLGGALCTLEKKKDTKPPNNWIAVTIDEHISSCFHPTI